MSDPPNGGLRCPQCGNQNPIRNGFCSQCGASLMDTTPVPGTVMSPIRRANTSPTQAIRVRCAHCDGNTPAGFPFCQQCGRKLAVREETVAASEEELSSVWGQLVEIKSDGSLGQVFPLSRSPMDLGRGADISLDDGYLALRHARFIRGEGGTSLLPLDKRNGVYRRVRKSVEMTTGDVLLLGREVLLFERVEGRERDAEPLLVHGVALFGCPKREPWGRLSQLCETGTVLDVRHLSTPEVILGREEGDLVFSDDEFMSRRHAAIRVEGERVVLEDLNSSNGSFVRLENECTLVHQDILRFGDRVFRYEEAGA